VFFLAVPASRRVREGASEMVAYRAGRVPRYYVDCPVTFARAISGAHLASQLQETQLKTPSSIG
jgi:hypothetical protein